MLTQFLLFVITILLISVFWVLSKINTVLKKRLLPVNENDQEAMKKDSAGQ